MFDKYKFIEIPNNHKVERQENSCSVEVFAALCKIYEVDPNDVIYR